MFAVLAVLSEAASYVHVQLSSPGPVVRAGCTDKQSRLRKSLGGYVALTRGCFFLCSIAQLAQLLNPDPARAGRADKLSTLADAVKEITKLRADSHQLRQLNELLEVSHNVQLSLVPNMHGHA